MTGKVRIFRISDWRAIKLDPSPETVMNIKTDVKAGGGTPQHNETLVVRSDCKAGRVTRVTANHNESFRG
jgi:hypothetical protein